MKKKKKGMTLIEALISLALFGIIAVCFLPLFGYGYKSIAKANNISIAGYKTQSAAESKLNTILPSTNVDFITIHFNAIPDINAPGKLEIVQEIIKNEKVEIGIFIPKY